MKIKNNKEYKNTLHKVYSLMNKGEANLTKQEKATISELAEAVEHYEDNVLQIMPLPVTVISAVQDKIEEMNITQYALSGILNIGTAKLSQILNGKRKPDVTFLKAIHQKLGVDGNFILEHV
ncbi:MAG: helix-turn-helix domain-containing protein [Niabella sp.]